MKGLCIAIGNFPEGNATAMRLRLLAKAFQMAEVPLRIALIHPTLKKSVPENVASRGRIDGIDFVYLNGKTVRPTKLLPAIVDTIHGVTAAIRMLLFSRNQDQPDFVLFYTPSFLRHSLLVAAAKIKRIPIFIEVCEIRSKTTGGAKRHMIGRIFNRLEFITEWLTPHVAMGVIPISNQIAGFYREKGLAEEHMFMLPILVDTALYGRRSAEGVPELHGKRYILNSGSFVEKDGIPYLIEAFARVAQQHPDIYLVFTGAVVESDKLMVKRAMADPHLFSRVIFSGMLSRGALIWAYQNAQALLCCRTNSQYANFGFPTKVGEYLSTGVPVIMTKVGDAENYLDHEVSALLAEPEDPESIARCMRFVAENPEKARAIGTSGRRVAATHFDYRLYGTRLVEFVRTRIGDL